MCHVFNWFCFQVILVTGGYSNFDLSSTEVGWQVHL